MGLNFFKIFSSASGMERYHVIPVPHTCSTDSTERYVHVIEDLLHGVALVCYGTIRLQGVLYRLCEYINKRFFLVKSAKRKREYNS